MLRYQIASTIGTILNFAGFLGMFQIVGQQFSKGSASGETLVLSIGAIVTGTVFGLLGDIGRRLSRIEKQLGTNGEGSDDFENSGAR